MATVLSAKAVADTGGETEFPSTYAAFDDLTDAEKERCIGLRVVHSLEASQRLAFPDPHEMLVEAWRTRKTSEHPLVWTHRSGRRSLVLGASTDHVVGMESRRVGISWRTCSIGRPLPTGSLAVPGIDAVYVGPSDLSMTMGLPPLPDHDDRHFQDALRTIVDSCTRHGVIPGIHTNPALAEARAKQGFRMITVGYDRTPVMAALRADLDTSRAAGQG